MRIIHGNWKSEIHEFNLKKKKRLRIVSPFIKEPTIRELLKATKPENIEVITRFNLDNCYDGVSDLSALRFLLNRGAVVQGIKGLHSKLYIYGGDRAIITSANLTQAGLKSNHEFGCVFEDPETVAECNSYFDGLWASEKHNLTSDKLEDWMNQVEDAKVTGGKNTGRKKPKLKDYGRKAKGIDPTDPDIAGVGEIFSNGSNRSRRPFNQAFIKLLGKSDNRVELDYEVIEEIERSGAYWSLGYPSSRRPRQPKDGDIMFMGRLVKKEKSNDIYIFGSAIAMQHVDERDVATQQEIADSIDNWRGIWDKYIRVHDAKFVSGTIGNGVPLSVLMDTLKENSFLPTQRNAAKGNGNLDPRQSFKQAPSIQLTEEAFNWLNDRLEEKFKRHGIVPDEAYKHMYWPKVERALLTTSFTLGKTYYLNGFFNLPVETKSFFPMGNTQGTIRLKYGEGSLPIRIERNKKTNQTTQPRVYGGAKLRGHFQEHYEIGDKIKLEIIANDILKLI